MEKKNSVIFETMVTVDLCLPVSEAIPALEQLLERCRQADKAFEKPNEVGEQFVTWQQIGRVIEAGCHQASFPIWPVCKESPGYEEEELSTGQIGYGKVFQTSGRNLQDLYDAARACQKIAVIKQVRAFTYLGLKEAKDLVEKYWF